MSDSELANLSMVKAFAWGGRGRQIIASFLYGFCVKVTQVCSKVL